MPTGSGCCRLGRGGSGQIESTAFFAFEYSTRKQLRVDGVSGCQWKPVQDVVKVFLLEVLDDR